MTAETLDTLLRTFRRQLALSRMVRLAVILAFATAMLWAIGLPDPNGQRALLSLAGAALVVWMAFVVSAARMSREVQTGSVLLNTGQLEDAEVWFRRALRRFSLSVPARLLAGQQLALLLFRREAHRDVVTVCRELLRHRLRRIRRAWFNTRLLLADSLLTLDRVHEAYEAMRPVYQPGLSLADRMKLLPLELRYELAADHADVAVQGLAEKTRIAELLDAPRAALVHALLAEACDRKAMTAQRNYLARRAWLYHDLDKLADRYRILAALADRTRAEAPVTMDPRAERPLPATDTPELAPPVAPDSASCETEPPETPENHG